MPLRKASTCVKVCTSPPRLIATRVWPNGAVVVDGAKCQASASPLRLSSAIKSSNRTPPDLYAGAGADDRVDVVGSHASFMLTSRSDGFWNPRTHLSGSSRAQPVALFSYASRRCSSAFLLCSGGCKRTYIVAKTDKENRTVVPSGSPTPLGRVPSCCRPCRRSSRPCKAQTPDDRPLLRYSWSRATPPGVFSRWMKVVSDSVSPPVGASWAPTTLSRSQATAPFARNRGGRSELSGADGLGPDGARVPRVLPRGANRAILLLRLDGVEVGAEVVGDELLSIVIELE